MSKAKDPFVGLKLSDDIPAFSRGRDQRLFAPAPASAPIPAAVLNEPVSPLAEVQAASAVPPPTPLKAAPAAPTQGPKEPRNQPSKARRNEGSKEPTNVGTLEPRKASVPTPDSRWNIKQRPHHRMSFDFTDDELDALEDLKRDAKRQYDLRTTKQDLVRHAIHALLQDYEEQGANSWILQKLRDA